MEYNLEYEISWDSTSKYHTILWSLLTIYVHIYIYTYNNKKNNNNNSNDRLYLGIWGAHQQYLGMSENGVYPQL